ncbi:unnamed protein product, partial [Ectocarpus sp. 12 AP-2014]
MASSAAPSSAAGEGGLAIGAGAAAEQSAAAAAAGAAAVEQPAAEAAAGKEDDDNNFVSLSARQEQQDPPKLFGEEDAPFADGVQQGQVDVESEIGGPLSPMTTSSIKDDCSTGSDFDWEGTSPTEPSSPALRGVHKIAVEVMRRSFGSAGGDPGMHAALVAMRKEKTRREDDDDGMFEEEQSLTTKAADLKQSLIDVSVDDIDVSGGKPSDRGGDGEGGGLQASPRPAGAAAAAAAAAATEVVASLRAAGAGAGGAGADNESGSRRGSATGEGDEQLPLAAAAVAAVAREAAEAASPAVAAAGRATESGGREGTAGERVERVVRIPPAAGTGGLNGNGVGQGEGGPGGKVDADAINGSDEGRAASNGGGEDSAGGDGGGGLVTRAIPRRPLREMLRLEEDEAEVKDGGEPVARLEHLPAFTERWAPEALTPHILSQVFSGLVPVASNQGQGEPVCTYMLECCVRPDVDAVTILHVASLIAANHGLELVRKRGGQVLYGVAPPTSNAPPSPHDSILFSHSPRSPAPAAAAAAAAAAAPPSPAVSGGGASVPRTPPPQPLSLEASGSSATSSGAPAVAEET